MGCVSENEQPAPHLWKRKARRPNCQGSRQSFRQRSAYASHHDCANGVDHVLACLTPNESKGIAVTRDTGQGTKTVLLVHDLSLLLHVAAQLCHADETRRRDCQTIQTQGMYSQRMMTFAIAKSFTYNSINLRTLPAYRRSTVEHTRYWDIGTT